MVRIFISPGNFWSSDGREAWRMGQEVGVKAISEFRIIRGLHWQTHQQQNRRLVQFSGRIPGGRGCGRRQEDKACPKGLKPL